LYVHTYNSSGFTYCMYTTSMQSISKWSSGSCWY
jgi:hypothetical protein